LHGNFWHRAHQAEAHALISENGSRNAKVFQEQGCDTLRAAPGFAPNFRQHSENITAVAPQEDFLRDAPRYGGNATV
jgi:hypothetical protein